MWSIQYKLAIAFVILTHSILGYYNVNARHVSEEVNENSKSVFHSESKITGGTETSRQQHTRVYDDPSPCNVGVACPYRGQPQKITNAPIDQPNAHIGGSTGLYPSLPSASHNFGIKTSPGANSEFGVRTPSDQPASTNYYGTPAGFIAGQPPGYPSGAQPNYPGFRQPPAPSDPHQPTGSYTPPPSYNNYPNSGYNSTNPYNQPTTVPYNPPPNAPYPSGAPSPYGTYGYPAAPAYNGPPAHYSPSPYPSGPYNPSAPYPTLPAGNTGYPPMGFNAPGAYNQQQPPQHQPPQYHSQYNHGPCVQGCPQNHVDHTLKINSEYNESGHHVGPFQQPSPGAGYGSGYNGAYNRGF